MKKKSNMSKKIRYQFDKYMSRGAIAQVVMLFTIIFAVVLLLGIILAMIDPEVSTGDGIWYSLTHVIDGGTIANAEPSNTRFVLLMGFVTIIGLVFTGSLISILNNALDAKMDDLRAGHSQIMERDHTVIVGFDQNVFCIIEELIMANDNEPKTKYIVVVDNRDVIEMENEVDAYLKSSHFVENHNLKHFHNTRILYRSGNVAQGNLYEQANLAEAKSVIVNYDDDFKVLRALLAVTSFLKDKRARNEFVNDKITITALLHEKKSINSADFVCKDFVHAEIMYFEDILAKILASVCRQPGLSLTLSEVFGYSGSEFYTENQDKNGKQIPIEGKTFGEVAMSLTNAVLIGVRHYLEPKDFEAWHRYEMGRRYSSDVEKYEEQHKDSPKLMELNPNPGMILKKDDKLIVLEVDDRTIEVKNARAKDGEAWRTLLKDKLSTLDASLKKEKKSNYLVLDWNVSLPDVLLELDQYVTPGSKVKVVSDREFVFQRKNQLKNFIYCDPAIYTEQLFFHKETIRRLLELESDNPVTNVLLVCEDGISPDEADAQTMMLLLCLREVMAEEKLKNPDYHINVTSEMSTADDQKLLQVADVNDFVVGSEIANRVMAQVSNEHELHSIYTELLESRGSEIYLRNVRNYIKAGIPVSFEDVQASVIYQENPENGPEICLGWKTIEPVDGKKVFLNPPKDKQVVFGQKDQLIVLSKGRDFRYRNVVKEG